MAEVSFANAYERGRIRALEAASEALRNELAQTQATVGQWRGKALGWERYIQEWARAFNSGRREPREMFKDVMLRVLNGEFTSLDCSDPTHNDLRDALTAERRAHEDTQKKLAEEQECGFAMSAELESERDKSAALLREVEELRKDKARLDRLEDLTYAFFRTACRDGNAYTKIRGLINQI
jgi:predicted  nucleic acid-binding Zn-ribbon protein